MDLQISVRAIAQLTRDELGQPLPSNEELLKTHRQALLRTLQGLGFGHIELTGESASFAHRFEKDKAPKPDILAVKGDRSVCICFAPAAAQAMDIAPLSEEQCALCESQHPDHDVYYAELIANAQEQKLYLLGPVAVRCAGQWQTQDLEQAQFLPFCRRNAIDRYSPIFGGGALFKLSRLIIPHALEHGQLPRFEVQGLFSDLEQGGNGRFALMCGAPPSYFMLVEHNAQTGNHEFQRPFFFYGNRPHAELELTRCTDSMVELLDKTGRVICADCLEATLFPTHLATGKHYKWTLSLVADRCKPIQQEFTVTSGPLHDQIRRDYIKQHGSEPPADLAVRISTEGFRTFYQEPMQPYAELCGKVSQAEAIEVDSCKATLLSIRPISQNEDVEVQVLVGCGVELEKAPCPGDVIECSGYLYASPDAMLESDVSWQDSGEVAALQENREQQMNSLRAYEQFSGYSLALGAVAAAFARAGFSLIEAPGTHTRQEASFVVQKGQEEPLLLFVDTLIDDAEPQYHYTDEQRQNILNRNRGIYGSALTAHHCLVHLRSCDDSESYSVDLRIEPECAAISPEHLVCDATQCPPPGLTEERACRIICNAICTQDWNEFARVTAEDITYASLVNGTRTLGKIDYIRYMAERKLLWEEQLGWPGMSMETGSITYEGEKHPCFMISCYGRQIGAAVVRLRHGLIANMETVPLEVNATYEPDRECTEYPLVYHPLRGRLVTCTTQQSPLQRYTAAYLQECMVRKTGFLNDEPEQAHSSFMASGVEFRLQKKGARWLKTANRGLSFCDLAFAHSGKIYAVRAIETLSPIEDEAALRSAIEQMEGLDILLDVAEKNDLIPCVFPASRGYTPNPDATWNLWHARTLQPIQPEQESAAAATVPSDWEIINAAIHEMAKLTLRGNGRVVACNDIPHLLPHFWFCDARGNLNWVIVRPHANGAHVDRAANEAEKQALELIPDARGYVIEVEAWGNAEFSAPARRGAQLYLRLSEPLPLGL